MKSQNEYCHSVKCNTINAQICGMCRRARHNTIAEVRIELKRMLPSMFQEYTHNAVVSKIQTDKVLAALTPKEE